VARKEVEKKRMVELENAMEELRLENSALQANKTSLKDELSTQKKNILIMLGETFNKPVRQAHILYRGPPTEGDFDVNKDVYEGCLVTFSKVDELRASTLRAARG